MSRDDDKTQTPAPLPAKRGGLRLVKSEPAATAAPDLAAAGAADVGAEGKPRPKSRIAQFMTAYADAIDRDVRLLLDL